MKFKTKIIWFKPPPQSGVSKESSGVWPARLQPEGQAEHQELVQHDGKQQQQAQHLQQDEVEREERTSPVAVGQSVTHSSYTMMWHWKDFECDIMQNSRLFSCWCNSWNCPAWSLTNWSANWLNVWAQLKWHNAFNSIIEKSAFATLQLYDILALLNVTFSGISYKCEYLNMK